MSGTAFQFVYEGGSREDGRHLLLLHGTGGTERDMLPFGPDLLVGAALLSPRGKVSEHGAARFFRRFAEGILDVDDWRVRTHELADFIAAQDEATGLDPSRRIAVGYSNGANIALGLLLLRPEVLGAAILWRPMFVTDEISTPELNSKRVLALAGAHDPLMHPGDFQRITQQLSMYGAEMDARTLQASHGLTQEDLTISRGWLSQ